MKEKDARINMKVSTKARYLVNLLAAFKDKSQSEVIEELAEKECLKAGLPIDEPLKEKN